jgi:hypothetical protein
MTVNNPFKSVILNFFQNLITLQSEMYVSLDNNYITKEEFDEMYSVADKARSKIGAFIKYLKQGTKTKNEERRTKNQEGGTKNDD